MGYDRDMQIHYVLHIIQNVFAYPDHSPVKCYMSMNNIDMFSLQQMRMMRRCSSEMSPKICVKRSFPWNLWDSAMLCPDATLSQITCVIWMCWQVCELQWAKDRNVFLLVCFFSFVDLFVFFDPIMAKNAIIWSRGHWPSSSLCKFSMIQTGSFSAIITTKITSKWPFSLGHSVQKKSHTVYFTSF